ncbi:MAG: hypothetical protein ABIF77_09065 [bacterium]
MQIQLQLAIEGVGNIALIECLDRARRPKRRTLAQEQKLLARSWSGERKAMESLVSGNQILVVTVSETSEDDCLSSVDRIAAGNVALISAHRRYQPELDNSFRGHCLLKIREAIEHALAEVADLRIVRSGNDWGHSAAADPNDADCSNDGHRAGSCCCAGNS